MSYDPLAGLLPAGNPLAPFDAAAATVAQSLAQLETPPELELLPGEETDIEADSELEILPDEDRIPVLEIAQDSAVPPIPEISPVPAFPQGRSRPRGAGSQAVGGRRRSRNAPLIAGMGLVVCVAIGVCVYLLASGFGISQHGELIAVRAEQNEDPANAAQNAAQNANEAANQPPPNGLAPNGANRFEPAEPLQRDPVMGGMFPRRPNPPPQTPQPAPPSLAPERPAGAEMQEPQTVAAPVVAPAPAAAPEKEAMESAAATEAAPNSVGNGASTLAPAIEIFRSGRYSEMMAAAEQAQQAATTPKERELAAGMALLAELADYYVEGIRRGAAGLRAAESFEIVPALKAIVVESSRDQVVLKVEGRVKSYPLESMPLVLVHRLTEFSLPADDPVARAAAAAYQSLWPQATDAHRRQAFEWWRELEGEAEGADFSQLEPAVREIFQMPNS